MASQSNRDYFHNYKKQAIQAAKELYYDKEVIARLENAKTDADVSRIMVKARKDSYCDKD